jgi:lipid-binding SYLF domain-containing protein
MKTIFACTAIACLIATFAYGALSKDEVKRLREGGAILTELRQSPDKTIPEELWKRAECVVVLPSVKKGALIVGGEYGSGVMSCRRSKTWSNPVFMQLAKGSVGLQIGGQQTDLVLLVMNRRGLDKLLEDKVSLGADASLAAGPVGRSASAATDAQLHAEILSYSHSSGLLAGIDLSGGVLRADKDADTRAYGPGAMPREVVNGGRGLLSPAAARPFLEALAAEVDHPAANN